MDVALHVDRDRAAVRDVLDRIAAAWQAGDRETLTPCFDERVVFTAPGFQARIDGRDACLDSYREFTERATLTEYVQQDAAVELWGDTAVATYPWTMAWESGGKSHRESGHDVLVFRRAPAPSPGWCVVWRTIVLSASQG